MSIAIVGGVGALAVLGVLIIGGVAIAGTSSGSGSSSITLPSVNTDNLTWEDYPEDAFGVRTYEGDTYYDRDGNIYKEILNASTNEYLYTRMYSADGDFLYRFKDPKEITETNGNVCVPYYSDTGELLRTEVFSPSGTYIETIYPAGTKEDTQVGTLNPALPGDSTNTKNKKSGCEDVQFILYPLLVVALMALGKAFSGKYKKTKRK